ncbi:phosphoinositide-specific phospholipase C [Xylaria bambusicola]|uniref:phosphoinositide-specific phospholipase C n=1 Tax=Xylaria bambusicola TaxID=326684 RepID=UPI002007E14C|nr:phosphoinositide-specific phospholipase C [Xylaria bambusicola]KAI0525431.1 phosphoinositide-specific phospholipase C [Xylaria bambusicola]
MAGQGTALRRARPSQVQTTLQPSMQASVLPTSAISASTAASGSHNVSPLMSPENSALTTSSSVQPSPDSFRTRDVEIFPPPPPLHLGDPLLSRKPSISSIGAAALNGSNGTMPPEAMNTGSSGKGLIRRFSNKFSRTRRQSSAAANSRDVSLGPGILRRRSDSTNTAPVETAMTDSDEELHDEVSDFNLGTTNATTREPSCNSNAPSITGSFSSSDILHGPVIPRALIKGTILTKVSKKKKYKPMLFTLESNAGKISWDKGRSSKCIYIDDIKDIRIGSDTRQDRIDHGVPDTEEGRFFTIFYALPDMSRSKQMHLIAEDEETFSQWVTGLDSISKHRELHMASLMAFDENAVRSFWNGEMAKHFSNRPHNSQEEKIDFLGVERVCRNLHIHMAQKELKAKFTIADTTKSNQLNYAEFQVFISEMKRRKDVRAIYRQIASDLAKGITWSDFQTFLRDTQGEDVKSNPSLWESRFIRYCQRHKAKDTSALRPTIDSITMTEDALAAYLVSKDNDHLVRDSVEPILDRPVNEYFISSSHNTYLIGRQVADVSSVEGYIMTLLRGCRSVEIDCWDGSDGQPAVKHGRALVNAISFREVINTVNKYAFVASRFPLWVSLEVHCNATQQEIMAETIKEVFGSRLVTEPLDPSADKLPSPTELKDRILIKVKGTHQSHQQRTGAETTGRRRGNSLTSPFSKPTMIDNGNIPTQYLASSPLLGPTQQPRRAIGKRVDTITEGEVHGGISSSTSDCETEEESSKRKTSKIVKALGDLGVYCSGVKFHGFESAECKKTNHILSFMEGTFRKHSKAPGSKKLLTRHNMRYMMRVYPQYSRLTSDNFNPLMYWRKGVQMAALNWQTFDLGMQLNQAMFAGGADQTGYVLKPESMRTIRILPDGLPHEAFGKLERQNLAFSIDLISAQRLMRPANLASNRTMDPYVEIEVFHANDKRDKHDSTSGIPIQTDTPVKVRTGIVRGNGFDPEFNYPGEFQVTTKYPELVFVKFSVKLSPDGEATGGRNPTVATYTVKLSSLKHGYRTLPLWDSNGDQFLFSTLFCRITVQPATSVYIPNPETVDSSVGKLKHIGKNVFGRSTPPKPSSFEKTSLDSGYGESIPCSISNSVQQNTPSVEY